MKCVSSAARSWRMGTELVGGDGGDGDDDDPYSWQMLKVLAKNVKSNRSFECLAICIGNSRRLSLVLCVIHWSNVFLFLF